jgi:ubiquinone biosynthesis protein
VRWSARRADASAGPGESAERARVGRLALVRRAAVIGAQVLRHASRFAVRRLRRAARRRPGDDTLLGDTLARLCEDLGPTFIKAGQILSARPDLLPPRIAGPLARLQDRIAPFDARLVPGLVEADLGRPLDELFAEFDLEPVSAASVAHVHRARLRDGRTVAVKIRRPGVVELVESDIGLMRAIASALSRLPGMRAMPLREMVEEVGTPIRQQLDFEQEARNNRALAAHFASIEHVKVPALVPDLCGRSVLTMEFLDDLRQVTGPGLTAAERRVAALAGLRALYKMIFLDGFIHADMHPGNVFVRRWGEFVMLDTGLMANLDAADRQDFVLFFLGLATNQGRECARIVYETATYRSPRHRREDFEDAMCELVAAHSSLKSSEFEITRFVYQLMETQRRFGIRGSTKFVMVILSMVVFDGICKQLHPECDFQAEARGFLITARYRRPAAADGGRPLAS